MALMTQTLGMVDSSSGMDESSVRGRSSSIYVHNDENEPIHSGGTSVVIQVMPARSRQNSPAARSPHAEAENHESIHENIIGCVCCTSRCVSKWTKFLLVAVVLILIAVGQILHNGSVLS